MILKKKEKGGMKKSEKLDEDFVENFISEMLIRHSEIVSKKIFVIKIINEKMGNIRMPEASK